MEKTVDINENSQFLEHLPSFTEETIPDLSQDLFGSFKLQGTSNPLEQLGLYMKVDDEDEDDEEEEVEQPESAPEPAVDVEEGEIDWSVNFFLWARIEMVILWDTDHAPWISSCVLFGFLSQLPVWWLAYTFELKMECHKHGRSAAMGLVKFWFGFYMLKYLVVDWDVVWEVLERIGIKDCFVTHEGGCAFGFLIQEELYLSGYSIFVCKKGKFVYVVCHALLLEMCNNCKIFKAKRKWH